MTPVKSAPPASAARSACLRRRGGSRLTSTSTPTWIPVRTPYAAPNLHRGFASAAPLRFLRQHRAPAGHFRLQEFAELFGRAVLRDQAHVGEAFAQVRVRERGADFGVQLLHDRARRAGGREHAAPTREIVAGYPAFDCRRDVRK